MDRVSGNIPLVPPIDFLSQWAPLSDIDGCNNLRVHRAHDIFGLWEAWEEISGCECPIPYWAEAWPGAIVLARYLNAHADIVKGKVVLDIGCGGGVAGIAAARLGASSVVAADTDPIALEIARHNAEANGVTLSFENRNLLVTHADNLDVDVVLAADLFYERSSAASTESFLRSQVSKGRLVIIADGERTFTPNNGVRLLHRERITVNCSLEGTDARTVRILELLYSTAESI